MQRFKRSNLILILAATFLVANRTPIFAQESKTASAPDPLLDTLNGDFRAEYQQALVATLAQPGPMILEEGDDLILVRNGTRTSVNIKPVGYHELKAVAHIPLALYIMLSFPPQQPVSAERRQQLDHYHELMIAAYASLGHRHFTPVQLQRQKMIFNAGFELLQGALGTGEVNRAKLRTFARTVSPMLLANVTDATALEMRELYATAAAWKKELTPAEWNALHVVMIGPHMPRDGECSIQFFERLFHEHEEGKRIIYAESLWNEKDALNLLATHEVDESAGAAFFGDPMRMHRDLLADAAKAYLDTHPVGR
jgi:hypothetical protein